MQKLFQPDTRLVIALIFSLGVVASFALVLGALIMAAYLLNLAVSALVELATNITSVYNRSDSLMQFFMLFLGCYIAFHVVRHVARPLSKRGAL